MQFSFISGLEGRVECAVTKFEDEPKLCEYFYVGNWHKYEYT